MQLSINLEQCRHDSIHIAPMAVDCPPIGLAVTKPHGMQRTVHIGHNNSRQTSPGRNEGGNLLLVAGARRCTLLVHPLLPLAVISGGVFSFVVRVGVIFGRVSRAAATTGAVRRAPATPHRAPTHTGTTEKEVKRMHGAGVTAGPGREHHEGRHARGQRLADLNEHVGGVVGVCLLARAAQVIVETLAALVAWPCNGAGTAPVTCDVHVHAVCLITTGSRVVVFSLGCILLRRGGGGWLLCCVFFARAGTGRTLARNDVGGYGGGLRLGPWLLRNGGRRLHAEESALEHLWGSSRGLRFFGGEDRGGRRSGNFGRSRGGNRDRGQKTSGGLAACRENVDAQAGRGGGKCIQEIRLGGKGHLVSIRVRVLERVALLPTKLPGLGKDVGPVGLAAAQAVDVAVVDNLDSGRHIAVLR
eukprot:comp24183_c0_seq2/m.44297 comp24183_c0_seq2/g.44297  ORF comp24183_c0_seq2/g.44297 comp24183_c0_seq2/m.44297 type:complete len:415 (+) comp24183_c0_seq2:456-1700(+)